VTLPDNPDLEKLKRDAKSLRDRVRVGAEEAVLVVREHHPRFTNLAVGSADAAGFKLSDAQLVLARRYGYRSWPVLRRQVQLINGLTRSPQSQLVGRALDDDPARADELLRLACLNYGDDDPDRWQQASQLLDQHPHLARFSIHTAAAVADASAVATFLSADPAAASTEGGPFAWAPLLYLTYSRLPRTSAERDPVAVLGLLLEAGADPNVGYLWNGLPSPFTALTGLFGHGEQGAPAHPDEMTLARLLLQAGAEANDSQTIYNRGAGDATPRDDTEFLELLLDFGLGRGDGGPWRRRLPREHQSPTQLVGEALQHSAETGLVERARLLLGRGADPNGKGTHPLYHGRSPYEGAILFGNEEIAALLAAAGGDTATTDPITRFTGLCLAADHDAVNDALAADHNLLERATTERPDLMAQAVRLDRPAAVRLLVDLGVDINTRHRRTALHEAALRGDLPITTLLIDLGADPTIIDESFEATPQGWAQHFGHTDIVEYLNSHPVARPTRQEP